MTPEILQKAVCLNNGTSFGTCIVRNLKNGVGLPNGSISQAKRFTVWSGKTVTSGRDKNGIDIEDPDVNGSQDPVSL